MEILQNENCNINDYCGHIILSYLEADKEKANQVKEWLNEKGYDYIDNEVSPVNLFQGSYCQKFNELLANCSYYIFLLTKNFNENNRPLVNVILYQIGVLEANSVDRVIPLEMYEDGFTVRDKDTLEGLDKDEKRDPQKTYYIKTDKLLLTAQKANSKERLLNNLKAPLSNVSFPDLYKAKEGKTLRERLTYRSIQVSFDITDKDFRDAIAYAKQKNRAALKTPKRLISWLNTRLSSGTVVFSFGTEATFTNNTRPYESESTLTNPCCLKMKKGRIYLVMNTEKDSQKVKAEQDNNGAQKNSVIIGRLLAEFIVPVHKLLGANFKCFLQFISPNASQDQTDIEETSQEYADILAILLRSNFADDLSNDVKTHLGRLYFRFNFKDTKDFPIPAEYGKKANYIYPQ